MPIAHFKKSKTQESLVQQVKSCYPLRRTAMNTTQILITERYAPLPVAEDYHNTIALMCRELAELHFKHQANALIESALEREAQEPTYIGRGLAIPHARVSGLTTAAVYVAHCESSICWPDAAADTVILLAVPAEQPELYLQLLSNIMRWRMKSLPPEALKEYLS